ncbi:TolC family outer membrane protein [uncultured Tateyamaria sp.]|uniref:TolC family outer membrane protein n=1 Tax=uncultured Tateyamaria sp. TaxID=455651 RepID=UPI0026184488|nr:TolC family outer membrane protein [uncultured Tateyamaria sp.]
MTERTGWQGTWRIAIAATVATMVLNAPVAKADTLADALVGAYNHSGLLDQNRALLRAADEDVAIAASVLKPIVTWAGNVTHTFGSSATSATGGASVDIGQTTVGLGINATLQLFDFGADANRIEAAKETVLATRASLLNVEQSILLRAAVAFFNVGRQEEFVALRRNNLRLLNEELRAAQDRFEVGEVTRTDVALAEAAVAQARSNLADAQRNLTQAQAEYTNVVGRQPGRLAAVPRLPNTETDISRAQAVAVRNHPEMDQAQRQVAANELLVNAADLDMSPTVTLQGAIQVEERFGSENGSETGSLTLNYGGPIYRGGSLSASWRRAIAVRDASRGNLHNVRHGVQQDVVIAISNLVAARASLVASERQIRAARVAFRGVREEANLGARTTLDVLDAEQDLLDAETNRISAQADQYIATYQVLESMGLLTAQRLQLPVQIYDPAAYYSLVQNAPARNTRQGRQLDRVLRALNVTD